VKRSYHAINKQGKVGERKLAEFLVRNGQALLPMLELIQESCLAIDELIDVMGRASVEAVLELSARQVAGPPQQGKVRESNIVRHGTQPGRVRLKERQLRVNKPRLRQKGRGANKEISVPAYEAMQRDATGERMLQILLNGVSTRRYQRVIPEMADTAGVSKSTVSREAIEASEAALKQMMERRFDEIELLIIYLDGMRFGDQCVLAAVGVDVQGRKYVLALREARPKTPKPPRICSSIWSSTGSIPGTGVYSSSTARKLCAPPLTRCSARKLRYKDVGITNCAMYSDDCHASSRRRRPR